MKQIMSRYLIVFLAVILLISLYICTSSFKTQMAQSKVSLYAVSANRLVGMVEDGLLYGKSLNNFYGMKNLLTDWAKSTDDVVDMKLMDTKKETVYCQLAQAEDYKDKVIDDSLVMEIKDETGRVQGYLNIIIDMSDDVGVYRDVVKDFVKAVGVLLVMGAVIIVVFCKTKSLVGENKQINKKRILAFTVILVLAMQLVFTAYSYHAIKDIYTKLYQEVGVKIQQLIQADVDKITSQGVTYEEIYQFEDYAEKVEKRAPIIDEIHLEKSKEDKGGEKVKVHIKTNIELSHQYIQEQLRKLLLEMITAMVITMFVAAEIVNYMIISIMRKASKTGIEQHYDKGLSIRVTSFIVYVACYLPVSLIPLMMDQITGGTASDFTLGLPTMVMFASGFIFTILSADLCLKLGWKKVLFGSVLLLIVSSLMAGLIQTTWMLILARGLFGGAYALIVVAMREFAAVSQDRDQRAESLAQSTAGLYAGLNIGAVIGSMVFGSIGFKGVFLVSAALGVLGLYLVKTHCIASSKQQIEANQQLSPVEKSSIKEGISLIFKDKSMVALILLISVPLAMTAMFFEYFLPIYAVKAEITFSDIGRAFLVNGIAVAYGAPILTKYLTGRLSEKRKLVFFMLLMAAGFILFGAWGSAMAIIVASFVMGLAEGNALVSENMIMLDLPAIKSVGMSRVMSFHATIRKLSQTIGPQIFALLMLTGYQMGMACFGMVVAVCGVLYLLIRPKTGGNKR